MIDRIPNYVEIEFRHTGEHATRPITAFTVLVAALRLFAGAAPGASSRLTTHPSKTPLERVELRFLG